MYRCRHRGRGCKQPRRTNKGLHRAAVLGMHLLANDLGLQDAIRRELGRTELPHRQGGRTAGRAPAKGLAELDRRRRKLLELHYADQISAELFGQQEREIAAQIEALRSEGQLRQAKEEERDEIAARFEQVASILRDLDLDQLWAEATDQERRRLVEEMVEQVVVFPDHLEVVIFGAPKLNVTLAEVGLGSQSQNVGVGGPSRSFCYQTLAA